MANPLLQAPAGEQLLLLGNEAIVRGALEAGIRCVTCYPGTPSSEVPDTFFRLSTDPSAEYTFEYSANEKVALEVGGGAALGGAMTLVTMKHVGVNVAADPLLTLVYTGAPGGLVLLSADDPHSHSSQNEQDNRAFARLALMPCLEPATAQEAKDMTRDALLLARQYEQPVLLRTTTRVNHVRGPVVCGERAPLSEIKPFVKNPRRFVPVPANARALRLQLLDRMEALREEAEKSPWNKVSGQGRVGVVASSICRSYLHDAVLAHNWGDRLRVFDLGFSYPLPEKSLLAFMQDLDAVLVLEELEPIVETELRALAQRAGLTLTILGKLGRGKGGGTPRLDATLAPHLPMNGEFSVGGVTGALRVLLDEAAPQVELCPPAADLPMRPPNLCAGCSHRALYYAVRQTFGDEAVYSSDIGCYTLGILPPLSAADFLLCMGSSVSSGCGFSKVSGRTVVGFIGDSTFFHSGITGLVNAVFNQHDLLVVILDNKTTAMTGHQPHPGVETTSLGPNPCRVDIEAIVRGCGVEHFARVSPFNLKATLKILQSFKETPGVRVLLAEEPCVLFARRTLRKKPGQTAYVAQQGEGVVRCVEELACPAYFRADGKIEIDEGQCAGCMFCLQTTTDVKARKRSA